MRVAAAAIIIIAACVVCNGLDNNDAWNEIARDDLSGSAGASVNWRLDEASGILTISGVGNMSNFSWNENAAPWYDNRSLILSVVIEDGVTSIGSNAFYSCQNITSMTIPSTVTYIGNYGISYCTKLTSLTIPSSVKSIGNSAFSGCAFPSLDLPSSVTQIGNDAFSGCKFSTVTIPSSVTSIGKTAFSACSNLESITVDENNAYYKSIDGALFKRNVSTILAVPRTVTGHYTIPDDVVIIAKSVFEGFSGLTSVTLPSHLVTIEERAFFGCKNLTSMTIPAGTKTIGEDAFYKCEGLVSVTLPASITTIGKLAFAYTNITTITLGENVSKIGETPFQDCACLQSINVDEKNKKFYSIDGVLFDTVGERSSRPGNTLLQYPAGRVGNYTVPRNTTYITKLAFFHCLGLQSVTITSDMYMIGEYAFQGCHNLVEVIIEPGLEYIMERAFWQCSKFPGLTLPGTVHSIGNYAFSECKNIWYVIYLGTTPPGWCSQGVFYYVLDKVCVPLDFTGSSFCYQKVNNHASSLEYLREQNNHCYEVLVCSEKDFSIYKRDNATEWESQSHGCYEYKCDNETGGVVITCNGNKSMKCVDDKCVPKSPEDNSESSSIKEESHNGGGEWWKVDVTFNGDINTADLNTSMVIFTISKAIGVDMDKVRINVVTDDNGKVTLMTVIVSEKDVADSIAVALNECSDHDTNTSTSTNGKAMCEGVLADVKLAVVGKGGSQGPMSPSSSSRTMIMALVTFMAMLMQFLSA